MDSEKDLTLIDYFAVVGLDKTSGLRVSFILFKYYLMN